MEYEIGLLRYSDQLREFRFYDASIKPDVRKPDEGLLFKLKYTIYLEKLETLWEFSRERVAAGSLDAMLPHDRRTARLRIAVDEAFLDEMTGWREELARGIYKNNRGRPHDDGPKGRPTKSVPPRACRRIHSTMRNVCATRVASPSRFSQATTEPSR